MHMSMSVVQAISSVPSKEENTALLDSPRGGQAYIPLGGVRPIFPSVGSGLYSPRWGQAYILHSVLLHQVHTIHSVLLHQAHTIHS
jgi:hypothetical protein